MPTLREYIEIDVLHAAGTSEGAIKGWDTRGRGNWRPKHIAYLEKQGFKLEPRQSEAKKGGMISYNHPDENKYKETLKHFKGQGFSNEDQKTYRVARGVHQNLDHANGNTIQVGRESGRVLKGTTVTLMDAVHVRPF